MPYRNTIRILATLPGFFPYSFNTWYYYMKVAYENTICISVSFTMVM